MAKGQVIRDMINIFFKDIERYKGIRTEKPESLHCGIISFVYTILSVVIGAGAVYVAIMLFEGIGDAGGVLLTIATVLGGVVLGLIGVMYYFLFIIRAIIAAVNQIKMSRKILGIIALIFNLLILAGTIIFVVSLITGSN